MLRDFLYRLIDETRRDQVQKSNSDSGAADEIDATGTTGKFKTPAALIAPAEEKLTYL